MVKKEIYGFLWLAVLALTLLLAGCMSDVTPPVVTPEKLFVRVEVHPSATPIPTATPGPTPTITPQPLATRPTMRPKWVTPTGPTSTSRPTYTPGPTFTPTQTRAPGEDLSLLFFVDGMVARYDLKTWSAARLVSMQNEIQMWALSPDGQWLATSDGNSTEIRQAPFDGEPVVVPGEVPYQQPEPHFFYFSPDSRWFVFPNDTGLKLLEKPFAGSVNEIYTFIPNRPVEGNGNEGSIYDDLLDYRGVFSPDSRFLLFSTYQGLYLYDIAQAKTSEIATQKEHEDDGYYYFRPISFSPDGEWAVVESHFQDWYGDKKLGTYLLHLPSGTSYEFYYCHRLGEWSADGLLLPAVADHCAQTAGLSLITTDRGTAVEKVIYQDLETLDDGRLKYGGMIWDETGEKLYFVKNIQKYTDNQISPPLDPPLYIESYIIVYDRRSGQTSEVTQYTIHHWLSLMYRRGNAIFFIRDDDTGSLLMRLDLTTGEISQVGKMWDNPHLSEPVGYPEVLATDDTLLYILDESGEDLLMKMDMTTGRTSQVGKVWDRLELDTVIPGTDWVIAKRDDLDGFPVLINYRTGAIVSTYFGSVTHSDSYFLGLLPKN